MFMNARLLGNVTQKEELDVAWRGVSDNQCGFYTVLTYDGVATWLPETPLNPTLREAFNRHQQTDKGFGPAAGPAATGVLAAAFIERGYRVIRGRSPWLLDASLKTLRQETDRGWVNAVVETGAIDRAEADAWLNAREEHDDAVTIVGHEDLLALPPSQSPAQT